MKTIKLFMKRPTTWVGIATALMFQLIFSIVWMTGYEGVTDRMDRLHVGIVNEDALMGDAVSQLRAGLPVQTELLESMDAAMDRLDKRELQMIVRIPATFSADAAAADRQAEIEYVVNESNPALIKSMMTSISAQVTAQANKAAVGKGVEQMLLQARQPAEQASAASGALAERVVGNVRSVNPVAGMNNQMVPMMMVLASFVGSMIMSMNLEQSSMALAASAGRWRRFGARSLLNLAAAIVVSLVGAALILSLGGQAEQGFFALWGLLFVILLSFLFVTQMFLLLFGPAGMLFNILLLSIQLVSSGAMVPRELLGDFYVELGKFLPATYAVESGMDVLFGGAGAGRAIGILLLIAAIGAGVGAGAVALKKGRIPAQAPVAPRS
ncbi:MULTISPECIES: YhgE/Pip domain-containing protein [Cohnella]|uniref:YhgE/Pip domain-containing protein n=1 Tax=Cohnella TaxID=329857 RepID=UPI0009B940D3|nr:MULTISPECIES: ABC transporter permease [Cohnella]MBN2980165.1 DUF3533 domain-containing protein [Cohnella algarum]